MRPPERSEVDPPPPPADPGQSSQWDALVLRFESECRVSLGEASSSPPIDSLLDQVSEPDRPAVRQRLEQIQRSYRERAAADRSGGSAADEIAPTLPPEAAGATGAFSLDDVSASGSFADPTADYSPSRAAGRGGSPPTVPADDDSPGSGVKAGGARPMPVVPGFELTAELGHGGMGIIYKARQTNLNRWVALKMILAGVHARAEHLQRFQTEAEAVARLQHPNIVQIYEIRELDGLPFLSLEFVDGGTLQQLTHRQAQPPRDAAFLTETLARAMAYAHEHNVVHRDLKPSNILLTATGIPKITDFGLAKRLEDADSGSTATGTIIGTPSYMAPEQARGAVHEIGPHTDIYSLGAILYQLLTGRPPFQAANPTDTILQVIRDEPTPPSRLQADVPRDLETICLKCLQKDSQKRYTTAADLADDLHRFLMDEPIRARPVTFVELYLRWCRRNRRLAALSASVFLLVTAWAVTSSALYFRIKSQKAETEHQFARAEINARLQTAAREEADLQKLAAQQAEKKAADNAALAAKQRGLALDTLYTLITKVEEKLRDKEGMSELRKDVLGIAMEGLNQVAQSAEGSSLADRSMGVALQRMGDLYEQLGKTQDAFRLYEASLKVFARLEKEDPNNDWIPWNQAVSYDKLASMSEEHNADARAAHQYLQRSLELREGLVARQNSPKPPPEHRKAALGISYVKLANLSLTHGDPRSALESARQGRKVNQELLDANPSNGEARRFVALANYVAGKALAHLGDPKAAREHLDACLATRQLAAKEDPIDAAAQRELGAAYEGLGDLQAEQGEAQAAAANYERARDIYLALLKKEPESAEDLWYLGWAQYRLGAAYQAQGRKAEAKHANEESLKRRTELVKTDADSVQFQSELMQSLARCGRVEEADKVARGMTKGGAKTNPSVLYATACAYALCATADSTTATNGGGPRRCSGEAIRCLSEAIANGYRDREALRLDPNLQAVRGTPEFQALEVKLTK